jgi:hypothetical protein
MKGKDSRKPFSLKARSAERGHFLDDSQMMEIACIERLGGEAFLNAINLSANFSELTVSTCVVFESLAAYLVSSPEPGRLQGP